MTSEPERHESIVKADRSDVHPVDTHPVDVGPGTPCPACGALPNEPCFPDCLSYVVPDRPDPT